MSALTESELQATARNYQDLLVPGLFQPWAEQFAASAQLKSGNRVLDVACGPGVLTREIARQTGEGGSVTGLDFNPGMLAVAEQESSDIEWREGNAESLPFDDESFDVVMSQFGLMLFEAPEKALSEMLRVLKPGGRLIVAVFDALENNPAYGAVIDAYKKVAGSEIATVLRHPFSMGDPDELKRIFQDAGVSDPAVSTHSSEANFDNARHLVLADVKGWFPFAGIELDDETISKIERAAQSRLSSYTGLDGWLCFQVSVHVIEASK